MELSVSTHSRPRLLLSFASTLLAVTHQMSDKLDHTPGPIGSLASKLVSVATPLSHRLHHPLLSILTFADDRLLAAESLAASLFPPADHLFDEMHRLADALPASLPPKVDGAFDVLKWVVARFPILVGAVAKGAALVDTVVGIVSGWPVGEERVIGVDVGEKRGEGGKVMDEMCESGGEGLDGIKVMVEEGEESDGFMSCEQKSFVTCNDYDADGDGKEVDDSGETVMELLEEGWHSATPRMKK